MPGNRFDSFMINAIDESYDKARCEDLLGLLLEHKAAVDIGMIGFSCHNHQLARKIADDFPEFEIIMTAYNYRNRMLLQWALVLYCHETYGLGAVWASVQFHQQSS